MVSCDKVLDETNDMPLCDHFVPLKFPCQRCNERTMNNKIDQSNEMIKQLMRDNELLTKRIEELERYPSLVRHLDNTKREHLQKIIILEDKVQKLEKLDQATTAILATHIKRIEKLENE